MRNENIRHFLTDTDVNSEEQAMLLDAAEKIRNFPNLVFQILRGQLIGMFFQEPSFRTMASAEAACVKLGAHPLMFRCDPDQFEKPGAESPQDCARILAGYCDLLIVRVNKHKVLNDFASVNAIPIINGWSDLYYPMQSLADLLTLRDLFGDDLKNRKIVYLGYPTNVCNSLILAAAVAGISITISNSPKLQIKSEILENARKIGRKTGAVFEMVHDPHKAVVGADAIYTDSWISRTEQVQSLAYKVSELRSYQVNKELINSTGKNPYVLHPLPAHRGEEITAEIMDGEMTRAFELTHNRLPTKIALFLFLLNRDFCEKLSHF